MSRFEERRADLARAWATRSGDDDVPALGLLALAEGLAEVIALLRPLVDTVTAKPEPLKFVRCQSQQYGVQCEHVGGHNGVHFNDAEGSKWTTSNADGNRKSGLCGCLGPSVDRGAWGVRKAVCGLSAGHTGVHADADNPDGVTW
jgi:hypothetical protein